jgi:hypothetical protein
MEGSFDFSPLLLLIATIGLPFFFAPFLFARKIPLSFLILNSFAPVGIILQINFFLFEHNDLTGLWEFEIQNPVLPTMLM